MAYYQVGRILSFLLLTCVVDCMQPWWWSGISEPLLRLQKCWAHILLSLSQKSTRDTSNLSKQAYGFQRTQDLGFNCLRITSWPASRQIWQLGYSVGIGKPMGLWVWVCEVLVRVGQSKPSSTMGFLKGLAGFLKRSLNLRYVLLR